MTTVNINYRPEKPEEYVWKWIDENLEKTVARKVPTENIGFIVDKKRQVIEFKGKTVKGLMTFKDGVIDMNIEIPLLYRLFGSTISASILDILKSM
ncbi:polyhydroxyalkanoic acid system family protein [bacterium]|nr:polyhydroxyalkanoic acid system family protein [bacterium]